LVSCISASSSACQLIILILPNPQPIARIRFARRGKIARCLGAINAVHPVPSTGTIGIDNPDAGYHPELLVNEPNQVDVGQSASLPYCFRLVKINAVAKSIRLHSPRQVM
jgi:hypothetical protein